MDILRCGGNDKVMQDSYRRKPHDGHHQPIRKLSGSPMETQLEPMHRFATPLLFGRSHVIHPLLASASIGILGVDISSDVQFRGHLEEKAALASKKLGVLSRAGQYFMTAHRLQLYKAQLRPHMEYCSHLWAGASKYQLLPLNRIQRRAARIIYVRVLSDWLDSLALRRDVASLCVFYRIYHGECSEELFGLIPAAKFCERTTRQTSRFQKEFSSAYDISVE